MRGRYARRTPVPVTVLLASVVLVTSLLNGCGGSDRGDRGRALDEADAARLVGAWDVTLMLERPLTQRQDSIRSSLPVTGTMAFTENRRGAALFAGFGLATDKGAYDLDLASFGLPVGADSRTQTAVARTTPARRERSGRGERSGGADSVFIALDPDDSRLSVRLAGVMIGDTVAGVWYADYLHASASGGFTMRRRHGAR